MFRSARLRLTAYIAGVLALVLVAAGSGVYVLLTRQFDAAVETALRAPLPDVSNATFQVRAVALAPPPAAGTQTADPGAPLLLPPSAAAGLGAPPPGGVTVFRSVGAAEAASGVFMSQRSPGGTTTVLCSVPAGLPDDVAFAAARPGHDDERTVRAGGARYRLLTRAVPDPIEGTPMLLQSGMPLANRDAEERSLLLALGGGGLLGLALVAAGGLLLTNRALQPLQLAFERQQRFVADASHELRTPLTLIQLEAEDLAGRAGNAAAAQPLMSQVARTSRLVEHLMTLARLDRGVLPVDLDPVHADSLLEAAAVAARRLAAPGVSVEVSAAPDCWIMADRDRLYEVLLILIDNAARVTPIAGRIRLSAGRGHSHVVVAIADSGPGITPEHLRRIFERFYRPDAARSRARGGTGLGLAIARELVLAQRGEIAIDSPPDSGVTVTITLPSATPPVAPEIEPAETSLEA